MTKKNKRNDGYLSIRKKLIAAVAMLLVATFMVASSSYAWFTLSTAPEITGIKTSVGANGNLEMALVTKNGDVFVEPTSAVGDSLKSVLEKNRTWGNLVDVSDSAYGLDRITLLPARLNVDTNGQIAATPLKTPVYGADGRIESLNAGTIVGSFGGANDTTFKDTNAKNGVYAIGNSTAMTQQQIDYRNNVAAAASALVAAKTYATRSLTVAGSDLASYAAKHQTGYTGTYDLTNMQAMIDNLKLAAAQVDNAMINIAIAVTAAKDTNGDDYQTATYADAAAAYTYLSGQYANTTELGAELEDMNDKRVAINQAIAGAETAYGTVNKTAATWDELTAVCGDLVNLTGIKINGVAVSDIQSNMQKLVDDVMAGKGITATLIDGTGTYADIANVAGNYSTTIQLKDIEYNSLVLSGPATMETKVDSVVNYKAGFPSAPTGSASSAIINDMYGYKIDMAFRTNATGSNLMLQTAATGRIYSSGASSATMGKGSTMTFETTATGFTEAQMRELISAIRILFVDGTGTIKVAGLNTAAVTDNTDDGKVEAAVQMITNATIESAAGENNGKITFTGGAPAFATEDSYAIMALTANEAAFVSVYVYLDGDYVENGDVAATAATSMTGTLNLQFSSSATLVPMNYAPLAAGDSIGGGTDTAETTAAETTAPVGP